MLQRDVLYKVNTRIFRGTNLMCFYYYRTWYHEFISLRCIIYTYIYVEQVKLQMVQTATRNRVYHWNANSAGVGLRLQRCSWTNWKRRSNAPNIRTFTLGKNWPSVPNSPKPEYRWDRCDQIGSLITIDPGWIYPNMSRRSILSDLLGTFTSKHFRLLANS